MQLQAGRAALPLALRMGISQSAGRVSTPDKAIARFIAENSPLPKNSHEIIERAVTRIGRQRLGVVETFLNAGLTTTLTNWWAVPSLRREKVNQVGFAKRSFVPDTRGERQVVDRGGDAWPIYCTSDDFSFNVRTVEIAGRMQYDIGTEHVENATYNVNLAIQDQALNGLTDSEGNAVTFDGLSAPGLLNSTTTFTYATWTGLTGPQIITIVQTEIDVQRARGFFGPWRLLVPANYSKVLTSDYGAAYPKTIVARIQELGPYAGQNLAVEVVDGLPDNRVVLVQMTSDVVDVIVGQEPTPISWQDGPKFNFYWCVLACMVFRMFPNYNGYYGVSAGNLA